MARRSLPKEAPPLLTAAALRQAPPLPADFYLRDAAVVAPELLGKILVHRLGRLWLAARIVEVEAYLGELDPASHAFRGQTVRNSSMFAAGGTCYVYLSYGMHHCLNVVTERPGKGQGCLLRAVEPVLNEEAMAALRGLPDGPRERLCNGPGKLTKALGLGPEHNGQRFDQPQLKLIQGPPPRAILCGPRIGISQAAERPLRFADADSRFVGLRGKFFAGKASGTKRQPLTSR